VVDSFRQFVGTEREKVEAKKQSMAKSERDKQLADLKKFHTNFKVSRTLRFRKADEKPRYLYLCLRISCQY